MVFAEATIAFPLIAGYAFHKDAYKARKGKKFAQVLEPVAV
jgi:deoxyhypusine synthase